MLSSLALFFAPEKVLPGSSSEPARSLGLMFGSRTFVLGVAFLVTSIRDWRVGLGWLFVADAALQFFDAGLAVVMRKGAVAVLPVVIAVLELWAARALLRGRSA